MDNWRITVISCDKRQEGTERDETDKNKLAVFGGEWGRASEACGELGSMFQAPEPHGEGPEAAKSLMESRSVKKAREAGAGRGGQAQGQVEAGGAALGQTGVRSGAAGAWGAR